MESIEASELAAHSAEYIARAKAGERIAVTEGGEPVACLGPIGQHRSVLDQLIAAGMAKPATGDLRDAFPPPPMPAGAKSLTDVLLEMREEERY
jgi:prevent-host-death family protein